MAGGGSSGNKGKKGGGGGGKGGGGGGASSTAGPAGGDSSKSKLKPATAINTRHILNEKHAAHLQTLAALAEPGAKFDEVARTHSEDKARQGGSLGWKTRGSLDKEFEKVAYDLEPSSVGQPKWATVKSGFGYHVIMVEGRR